MRNVKLQTKKRLMEKLKYRKEFYLLARGGFSRNPLQDSYRVSEIWTTIAGGENEILA